MITQKYNLSMIPCGVNPVVRVSQYDDGLRSVVFHLTNNEMTVEDAEVVINGQTVESSIEDGEVSFIVRLEQTQESGVKRGEVRISNVGSLNFKFYVEKTPITVSTEDLNLMMSNSLSNRQTSLQSNRIGLDLNLREDLIGKVEQGEISLVKEPVGDLSKEDLQPISGDLQAISDEPVKAEPSEDLLVKDEPISDEPSELETVPFDEEADDLLADESIEELEAEERSEDVEASE